MERFNALGRGTQLMLVGAVLLFIDLFLPWQKYTGPGADFIEAAGGDTSLTAFHGFGGWVLGLLTLVLIAWIVARMAAVDIPIPVSAAMTAGVFAFLILIFAVIKALVDDYSGWAAWVGIVLAAIVAVGAWLQIQEAGGVDQPRIVRWGGERHDGSAASGFSARAGSTCAGTTDREYGERGPGGGLERGGCGLGRTKRRAVDRAGQVVPLTARNPAAVRRGGVAVRSRETPGNTPLGACPSTL